MTKTVSYQDKFTSASTVYADIDITTKTMMLEDIHQGYLTVLERANYDAQTRELLSYQDKCFRKHVASGDKTLYNSLQSFLAGLLRQHLNKPNKDISTKMLEGLSIASQVLNRLGASEAYEFEKASSRRVQNTPFEKLFQ